MVVATDPTNRNVESNDHVFPCKQLLFISSYVRTVKFITEIEVLESKGYIDVDDKWMLVTLSW